MMPFEMTTVLKVEGMTCQNCVRHAREALSGVAGVTAVEISLDAGEAEVRWNAEENIPPLLAALKTAGYPGSVIAAKKKVMR
jgi:copper chaperone CopZ